MSVFDDISLPVRDDLFVAHTNMMEFDNFDTTLPDFPTSNFMSINAPTSALTNRHTVSPQELMKDTMIMSAPSSTAFPNLSTPGSSYIESPFLESSSLDTSPMVNGALDSSLNATNWPPLFPPDNHDLFTKQPVPTLNTSFTSVTTGSNDSVASPMVRQTSSPGRPSTSSGLPRKHSDAAGVKPSRARRPLAAIVIAEEDDKETAKRKKNTAAARKSRERKQQTHETLLAEIDRLRAAVMRLGGNPDEDCSL